MDNGGTLPKVQRQLYPQQRKVALGANDKVQMAIIGAGNRGFCVFDSLVCRNGCKFPTVGEGGALLYFSQRIR